MHQGISTSKGYNFGKDLSLKEEMVINEVLKGFSLELKEIIHRSFYWTTNKIGAVILSCEKKEDNKTVESGKERKAIIVKIQGDKPFVSEALILKKFNEENRSSVLRPPKIYGYIPWDEKKEYEVILMEDLGKRRPVSYGSINKRGNIDLFFNIYEEYRKNSLPRKPWFEKPEEMRDASVFVNRFDSWWEVREKSEYREHKLASLISWKKVEGVKEILKKVWSGVNVEFVHGHFSPGEIFQLEESMDIVGNKGQKESSTDLNRVKQTQMYGLTGNLFWGFKPPMYDLVFGYHWHSIMLNKEDISDKEYERELEAWVANMERNIRNRKDELLYKAAFLERACASLILDILTINEKRLSEPIVKKVIERKRRDFNDSYNLLKIER